MKKKRQMNDFVAQQKLTQHLKQLYCNKGLPGSLWASHVALLIKNPPANAGDIREGGLSPELGRSPGGGHGNLP